MPSPIVLLTDFGMQDPYVGLLKAVIYRICPDAPVLDLCHGIAAQNVIQASSVLESSYEYYVPGSIFVCVVDPGVGTKRHIICAKTKNYYFVGPDNGLMAPAIKREKGLEVRAIENEEYFIKHFLSQTFHGRDIMVPAAAHLAKTDKEIFEKLGPKLSRIVQIEKPEVETIPGGLRGTILYFDHFGNAITNIHPLDAKEGFWKEAKVFLGSRSLGRIRKTYGDGPRTAGALFNSFSQLEIALPEGSAEKTYHLQVGDKVEIRRSQEPREKEKEEVPQ